MVRSATRGVSVTKLNSEVFMSLSRDDGPPGDVTISGSVRKLGSLIVIPYATIKLWVNGFLQATKNANIIGGYTFVVDFDAGSYSIFTEFVGNDTYYADTSPQIQGTYSKIGTGISITVSPDSGAPPLTVTIMGQLTSDESGWGLNDKRARLYKDDVEIDSMLTKASSGGAGFYIFTDVIDVAAEYYVEFEGDDEYEGCEEESALPCTLCGSPVPLAPLGSEVKCLGCHSVFETVIV